MDDGAGGGKEVKEGRGRTGVGEDVLGWDREG